MILLRPQTTNLKCVNSDSIGYYCIALKEIDKKCLTGECPFYKTDYQFKVSESKAKERCDCLGYAFKTRTDVIDDMSKVSRVQKDRYNRERKLNSLKVIQYNSQENTYIEHDSIDSVAKSLGISTEKVEHIIRYREPYKGYRFVFA